MSCPRTEEPPPSGVSKGEGNGYALPRKRLR